MCSSEGGFVTVSKLIERWNMDLTVILARILAVVVIFVLLRPPEEASQGSKLMVVPTNLTKRR